MATGRTKSVSGPERSLDAAGRNPPTSSFFPGDHARGTPQELASALSGTYELIQEIDRGGMGVVYAARDIRLDRLVAIKVLPDLVSSDVVRERFLREARAAARLSHPSIDPTPCPFCATWPARCTRPTHAA